MRARLKQRLSRHLSAVGALCAELAGKEGVDSRRGLLAGRLHDRFKPSSRRELALILRNCREKLDFETANITALWHGPASAAVARAREGVRDDDLLEAIRWHSTGKAGMSALGKALFVADFCAEGRGFREAFVGRKLARRNLHLAVRYVLACKLAWLFGAGVKPHRMAVSFWKSIFWEVESGR